MYARIFSGLGLFVVLSFFLTTTSYAYNSYGPQTSIEDKYLYFGSETEPSGVRNGITITVDPESISFQTVKAMITIDDGLIEERGIDGVYIMANKVVVDKFFIYYDNAEGAYKRNYYVDLDVDTSKIGSNVYFQAVGVHAEVDPDFGEIQYVVSWSEQTGTYELKPLPVIDRAAIEVLYAILAKLESLKAMMEAKLAAIQKAIEDIYTPSPEAEAKLQTSMDNFMDKLPMKEMQEKIDDLNDALQESKDQLSDPDTSSLKLGGKFRLIPELAESEITFLDLTEYKDQVKLFRTIMEAAFWVYFFYMLLKMITPSTQI